MRPITKTLHLSLVIFTMIIFLTFGSHQANANNVNDVYVQNIKIQPAMIKIGDAFTVTITLVNNSTVPVWLDGGKCSIYDTQASFFTVILDNHAKIKAKDIFCGGVGWSQVLDAGKSITETYPDYTDAYVATEPGTANATVTFSYHVINQTSPTQAGFSQTMSKSILFTILDNKTSAKVLGLQNPLMIGPGWNIDLPSPLKQFNSGVKPQDVKCQPNYFPMLIIKAQDGTPACVKPDTAQKLIERGWGTTLTGTTNKISSKDVCGQFYTAPGNRHDSNAVPVLLMSSNSTACIKLTFTIYSNYKDCNGQTCQHIVAFDSTLHIRNLHYEKHDNMFGVSPGKDYTNSFNITTIPDSVDLANYPIGTNFTVTYIIKPLPNATGFYDQSIPKLACESYPLAVGYSVDQVNASDFSYIDQLNPPCALGVYTLTGVEISGMTYKQVTLQP